MNEDIVAIGGFFFTVIVLTLGIPISEGQRFVTRLLAGREKPAGALPAADPPRPT